MKNILLIGCGLLGSSLLRRIHKKKIARKIFVYEKSKKNISKIKSLKLPGTLVKELNDVVSKSQLIIFFLYNSKKDESEVDSEKFKLM